MGNRPRIFVKMSFLWQIARCIKIVVFSEYFFYVVCQVRDP